MILASLIEDRHRHLIEALQTATDERHSQLRITRSGHGEPHLKLRSDFVVPPLALDRSHGTGRIVGLDRRVPGLASRPRRDDCGRDSSKRSYRCPRDRCVHGRDGTALSVRA